MTVVDAVVMAQMIEGVLDSSERFKINVPIRTPARMPLSTSHGIKGTCRYNATQRPADGMASSMAMAGETICD